MIEYSVPRLESSQPILEILSFGLSVPDVLFPKKGEAVSDPFSDVFGVGELSFFDLQEELGQLGLGETVLIANESENTSFKSDFELVDLYMRQNFGLIAEFRGMVMEKAASQVDMCGGHASSSSSISVTSGEVTFTSLSGFGSHDENSEKNHKHCGNCGSEYEGESCPKCAH